MTRLRELFEEEGIVHGGVAAGGVEGEVAIVRGVPLEVLRSLSPRVRALGFRYVSLDLGADEPG